MLTEKLKICNQLGLHARACSELVNTASRYQAETWVEFSGKRANAKSIMTLLVLGAAFGDEVSISADGEDEQQAMAAICDLIRNRFGEEE